MKCVLCGEETVELSKNIPLHGKCREGVKERQEALANKIAKDIHEKMEGVELFDNFDEILDHARKTTSIHDTLKALRKGEI